MVKKTVARALNVIEEDKLIEAGVHPRYSREDGASNRDTLLSQRVSAKWIAEHIYDVDLATAYGKDIDKLWIETMNLTFGLAEAEVKNS
jgi:hypothetical protein